MLSLKYIRENINVVTDSLISKNSKINISNVMKLDGKRLKILKEVEDLRSEKNKVSLNISKKKKHGSDAKKYIDNMRLLSNELKELEGVLKELNEKINNEILYIPNIVHSSVPIGKDSASNKIIKEWGQKPSFSFSLKNHIELLDELKLCDFKRAAKISGTGFPLYTGLGARLERALINFMLDCHTDNHGYEEVFPPFLVNEISMTNTGQLPKFEEDMYNVKLDKLFCIPTAEVPITNIHQGEILNEYDLPKSYVAYSACFRREAGSYGKETKGLSRLHQFNKVELVKFAHPKESYSELNILLEDAEYILQKLGLHYRIIELCSGDLSFSAAKCYDIEVWSPSDQKYIEVSSCSNFENFQSTRGNIRFKNKQTGKLDFVHTLNGSGVATPRLMIALIETYQQENGSIILPKVLEKFMNLREISKA